MDFFTDLSIRNKVLTAFSVILLLTTLLGVFAISRVEFINSRAIALSQNVTAALPLGSMARDAHEMIQLAEEAHIAAMPGQSGTSASPADPQAPILAAEASTTQDFATAWAIYQPTMDPGRETDDGNTLKTVFASIQADAAQMAAYDTDGNHAGAASLLTGDLKTQLASFDQAVADDFAYQTVQTDILTKDAQRASRQSVIWIAGILALLAAGTLAVGSLIVRSVATPIRHMTNTMRKLSQQNMNAEIPGIGRRDELGAMAAAVQVFKENGLERQKLEAAAAQFQKELDEKLRASEAAFESAGRDQQLVVDGLAMALSAVAKGNLTARLTQNVAATYQSLKTDFNAALDTMQTTLTAIAASTRNVRSGASEITTASDDLSRRTEQQAASLEETAAALDEITATVRKTAEGAGEARKVATESKADAEHSGAVVRETVQAMSSIDSSSKEISNIIGVIDEIAFQTNLLALNAGVEAARAGDAGRGFAVVATEVRALAQRSADAAKEIKALISASRLQVESGVKLVDETGTALNRIVGQVTRLNTLIADIAASATEQATGLNEVNTAVNQMDQVTQQNAAMVEQTTAASHSLANEAAELGRLIGQFELGQGMDHSDSVPPPRHSPRRAAPASPAKPSGRIPVHAPTGTTKPRAPALTTASPIPGQDDGWDEF
ncbi:methyl-accepting chemotaxis protein [Acidocella sp.]|uniref:methyl-accepting chemotaxis protein n=1 Tax=Acidocella sp. TaxID=50710 RepID=UPI00262A956B|nr:methyl-accepting chemotaxis protein [Acidocella sp.]